VKNYEKISLKNGTTIGEMTKEEIIEELERARKDGLDTTKNFILMYMKLMGWKDEYPEYYL